jgi:uncharacterized protein YgiM (DUF1202 family)
MNLILKVLSTSIVGLVLLFSLMTVQARDTEASTGKDGLVVTKGAPVNIRAGKGTNTAIVDKAKNGEKLRVLESAGEWYKVKLSNGKTGYIRSDFLKTDGQATATDKPEATNSGKGVGVVTASTLNIRADKDSGAELVGKLKKGEKLQVLDNSGEWYQVKLNNGKVGYAFGSYIKMGATEVEVDSKVSDASKDAGGSKDAGDNNQKIGVVSTQSSALRIRADKNINAKVVGTVAKGAKVKVLEKAGKWYKVELDDGTQGYANSQYIKSEGEPDHIVKKLDKPSTDSLAKPALSKEGVVATKSAPLNIRATKDPKAKVVGKADKGTKVKILEKAGDWYKIKLKNGTTGYASSQFIQVGTGMTTKDGQGEEGIVTTKSAPLNIRADKDASAKVVGQVDKGSTVQILEKAGEWYKVKLEDGTTGYASSQFIEVGTTAKADQGGEGIVTTKSAPLNIRADKDASAKVVGQVDKGSTVQILEKAGEWYKVKLEDGTTGYASGQFIEVGTDDKTDQTADKVSMGKAGKGEKNYGVVTTKSAPLNIRATKARDAKIVGKADKGSKLLILEKAGEWYKVQLQNGKSGYASSQFIKEE